MAATIGSSGGRGVPAGCGEMFERFISAAAPAETKVPAATTAASACEKEAEE